jgi:DNA-binding transcriptional MerR regulator
MALMTIGAFADRTRLSCKALRLYDQLGLVVPARIDPASGYRLYREDQVERAQLVGLLRRVDMPLATIGDVLAASPEDAARLVAGYWEQVEAATAERRAVASYLQARLTGVQPPMYDIRTRTVPERTLLTINRHLHTGETDAFFDDAFARLRSAGPGLGGIAGAPFVVFYGEVSEDSDGPLELCRPVAADVEVSVARLGADVQRRREAAHDEAFVRLSMAEMGWPAMLPAVDALEAWTHEHQRRPSGPLRQVLIADQREAAPGDLVCDLSVPLFNAA